MRRRRVVFSLVVLGILCFLLHSVFTLLTLLFEDASADAIPAGELSLNSTVTSARPSVIPKIIHQTYKNETIPEIWSEAQRSCIDLHPDYQYILWTDEKAYSFISIHYDWFLGTFESYKYPIQRADTIRYFVLSQMGGIYIDLDNGCNRRLDPLLSYPAWVRRTTPTGISNDAMGSIPQHPFFLRVIQSLKSYNRSWFLPYITIMYTTGPLFLSVIWKEYMRSGPDNADRVRVVMRDEYMHRPWSFFTHHQGNSWHRDDARLIFWLGAHWQTVTVLGIASVLAIGMCLWLLYSRLLQFASRYHNKYGNLRVPASGTGPKGSPPAYHPLRRCRSYYTDSSASPPHTSTQSDKLSPNP
ncbi:nucleotide-diphospho-sugar transferase [Aspergillus granulosus]|uniref:Nucleotide-diphospho-sugar transferase n=1 Tax=Aspergillus granulosus TaxID=176169 RepID=A0ABR4H7T4_9EURO